jgi:transcriptional regulator with XRE-family HTH domain
MRSHNVAVAFGKVLREIRRSKGMSQEDLAGDGNFDRTYPSLLERGLRTPTLSVIFEIAATLGVHPSHLVNETLTQLQGRAP